MARGTGARARLTGALATACGLLCGLGAAPAAGAPQSVLGALHRADAPVAQLQLAGTAELPGGTEVRRYQQVVGGLLVLGGEAAVTASPGTAAGLLFDRTRGRVERDGAPKLNREDALAIARERAGVQAQRAPADAQLVLIRSGRPAWLVTVPAAVPLGDFEVLVDARNGTVRSFADVLRYGQKGHARIFDPNPVVTNGGDTGLFDGADADSSLLTSLRRARALRGIQDGQSCLRGPWAHAVITASQEEVCRASLDWEDVTRSEDSFEGLMSYYHVDQTQRYIRRLGFTGASSANARRQLVIANGITDDNSFYSRSTKAITLGSGGVDDAEDADVIVHEYGHAVQDDQRPGFGQGRDAGAMGEGFGDYLQAVMSKRSGGRSRDNVCVFDWDAISWGSSSPWDRRCGRRADDSRSFSELPLGCRTEIHCLGQIWSSALWDLRGKLGSTRKGNVTDRVVIASHFLVPSDARFDEAVNALECADEDLYPQGDGGDCRGRHYREIHEEMTKRGLA